MSRFLVGVCVLGVIGMVLMALSITTKADSAQAVAQSNKLDQAEPLDLFIFCDGDIAMVRGPKKPGWVNLVYGSDGYEHRMLPVRSDRLYGSVAQVISSRISQYPDWRDKYLQLLAKVAEGVVPSRPTTAPSS